MPDSPELLPGLADGDVATLPEWLWGTATHLNCPKIYLVEIIPPPQPFDEAVLRPPPEGRIVAFRGIRLADGAICASQPMPLGHDPYVFYVEEERIQPLDPRATARRAFFSEPSRCITIEIEGGVLQDVYGLPEGWSYELDDHDAQDSEGDDGE